MSRSLSRGVPVPLSSMLLGKLFRSLQAAYDLGDQAALTRLWREAQPVQLGAGD